MAETYINKSLNELIDDFRYTMNFALEVIESTPSYFWWEEEIRKKVENLKEINKKYFEGE